MSGFGFIACNMQQNCQLSSVVRVVCYVMCSQEWSNS